MPCNPRTWPATTTGSRSRLGALALAIGLFVACGSNVAPSEVTPGPLPACEWFTVVHVIDGDTIIVAVPGGEERVRYIGVDTPELAHFGDPEEPFAAAATRANEALVAGREVCLERDISERDRYGRFLRYAWLADGRMVNEELLRLGMAQVATFPPDVKYLESRFLPAQRAARESATGLWGE